MGLRPREIEEGRPVLGFLHDAQVHLPLRGPGPDDDRPLGLSLGQDADGLRVGREAPDDGRPVPARGQDVDVPDGLLHPAQGAGGRDLAGRAGDSARWATTASATRAAS